METLEKNHRPQARFGFYISLLTSITTLITFSIAFKTPPLSGPGCASGCFEYPYTGIESRFPRDYYWMYPTMLISILFLILIIVIHEYADDGKKIYSRIGMAFSVVSAAILIPNYFIQVSVVQPSLVNGEAEGIALITQFNPHGIFIALEEAGFLLMNLALFSIIPVFAAKDGLFKALRITFLTGFLAALFSLIYISARFGIRREYILEIMIISIVWLELIISSTLLCFVFKRELKK
ncbi:MAG TPA: hypothetical protein VI583_13510 [Cyclobacteriaceae bacterium]|nr:hypothetical protein [Cyclobacteriaceae bacterium]